MIRILTYNIHKCIGGMDRHHDPGRVVDVIAHHDPHIALLQEVGGSPGRTVHGRLVDVLGDRLGFRHRAYFANVRRRGGVEYGNAVLSRFPLTDTENIDLTVPLKKKRSVLHTRVRIRLALGQLRTVHVFNLHLGLSGLERRWQLRRFLRSHPFAGLHARAPIIIGGDFNDVWGVLGKRLLLPSGFRDGQSIFTFPAYAPIRALDSLYVRGDAEIVHISRSHLDLAKRASDHLPLIAEVKLR